MQLIRFAASAAMSLILLALAAFLYGPSFAMPTAGVEIGLGRGALPQFCVVAGAILAVIVFLKDAISLRRTGSIEGPQAIGDAVDPGRVVVIGFSALVLLAAYLVAWAFIGFLPASIAFMIIMSMILLPRDYWNTRSLTLVFATGGLFGLGVWALFVYVLEVPLR